MTEPPLRIRPLVEEDVPAVAAIEARAFEESWPPTAFERELRTNRLARYLVVDVPAEGGKRVIVGFAGIWLMVDQAHVVSVAVDPPARRRGLGRLLVYALLLLARDLSLHDATLEVRASNAAARTLYRKMGFWEVGERKRYYDNSEDAVIMTTDPFASPAFERALAATSAAVERDCSGVEITLPGS